MISLIYWLLTIVISIVFNSWTLFIVLGIIWIVWMIIRAIAKNGVGSDSGDSWWIFDSFDSSGSDDGGSFFDDFGGGDFGGGGAGGDWSD